MSCRQKKKGWIWKLTWPFAHNNFTTFGETIHYPNLPAEKYTLEHEKIHIRQQKEVGMLRFLFLYLFAAPVLFNPWRKRWETEAYRDGSKYPPETIKRILRSSAYGWLI